MADYTVTVDFPDHKLGDHWPAVLGATPGRVTIGPVTIDGETPDAPLQRIRFQFKHRRTGRRYVIDSEVTDERDAEVVIDDADTWEAHIPEIAEFLPITGEWDWDAEFYDNDRETPLTIYKGTITVNLDV